MDMLTRLADVMIPIVMPSRVCGGLPHVGRRVAACDEENGTGGSVTQ
jgi:hypothetical protein